MGVSDSVSDPLDYTDFSLSQACLLLTGLAGAILTAPLFDRVFTYHLALTAKVCRMAPETLKV